jgi:hypothetical protein
MTNVQWASTIQHYRFVMYGLQCKFKVFVRASKTDRQKTLAYYVIYLFSKHNDSLMFVNKAGTYLSEALKVRLLALPTNFRIGWKGLLVTNPLAHYEHLKIKVIEL